jgi:Leu/Phe-tRNA-protein transferase
MVQINHEQDPCCFHGCGRHDRIRAYSSWVASQARGTFAAAVTVGNAHETNWRDKTIIGGLVDRLREGTLSADDVNRIPFNTLREW